MLPGNSASACRTCEERSGLRGHRQDQRPPSARPIFSHCHARRLRVRLTSGHGWNVALCEQMFKSLGEPQIRTSSRQYFCDAMLLRTTPMPDTAACFPPNAARCFSVTTWNSSVVFVQAFQDSAQEWDGNGKPQPQGFDWSPRPATKPLRASPNAAAPILVLSPWSVSSPGRPPEISSNRRRTGNRRTASPSKKACA